ALHTLEGSPREAPSCGDFMSTAKTTVLPASDIPVRKKGLIFKLRLDDSLGPIPQVRRLATNV
ncbi:hypothetical protein AB4Z40_32365, partial [Bosea sp. 2YAB26]|uniref:hypothetical protein n=1 Tax=Bosea sp. 2YAB26 TaxID=3237478 RepID=UPI003F922F6F